MAQEGESGEKSNIEDIRNLKIGEIDPNPESKPARPDPVDMDEDEKEMLSEARARLANTRGKKAKRKAREYQLENARRMATLQKLRELRAAGVHQSARNIEGRKKRKAHEIDYNAEIPFERPAPAGFYDVSKEKEMGTRRSVDPREKAKMLAEMNRKSREEKFNEKKEREKAKKNFDKFARDNLPEALKKISEANDPATTRIRSNLVLPPPNVADTELEEIAKPQKYAAATSGKKGKSSKLDFSKLPEAKFNYDYMIKINVEEEKKKAVEVDASDLESQKRKQEHRAQKRKLKCRSLAVQRDLPRPKSNSVKLPQPSDSNGPLSLLQVEVSKLVQNDIERYPMIVSKKKKKARSNPSLTEPEQFTLQELEAARHLLDEAIEDSRPAIKPKHLMSLYGKVIDETKNQAEDDNSKRLVLLEECKHLRNFLSAVAKRSRKAESHAVTLTRGLQIRVEKATKEANESYKKSSELDIQNKLFSSIIEIENRNIAKRKRALTCE